MGRHPFVLIGGSGFFGSAVAEALIRAQADVVVVDDRRPPEPALAKRWTDLDRVVLLDCVPEGHVVILLGFETPRPRWPWTLPFEIAVQTGWLLPTLRDRQLTLVSSVAVCAAACSPCADATVAAPGIGKEQLAEWCDEVRCVVKGGRAPWRVAALCRKLAEGEASQWLYGASRATQEMLVSAAVPADALTVLRLADGSGVGETGLLTRLIWRGLAGQRPAVRDGPAASYVTPQDVADVLLADPGPGNFDVGSDPLPSYELAQLVAELPQMRYRPSLLRLAPATTQWQPVDTAKLRAAGIELRPFRESLALFADRLERLGSPLAGRLLRVMVPPRAARPDVVADRQQEALWQGRLKYGGRWTTALRESLRTVLGLGGEHEIVLTGSGTDALRLAVLTTVGVASHGDVAVVPSFTYRATADVLVQLGYRPLFVDVDAETWTLDPSALETLLERQRVTLVVSVDTFGAPCDYSRLVGLCGQIGVPLVSDSAAALGSRVAGVPVGAQVAAHAFSMSFGKLISAAGAGGVAVIPHEAAVPDAWAPYAHLDELHAIAALDQVQVLDDLVERRARIAALYGAAAADLGLRVQSVRAPDRHNFTQYVVRVPARDDVAQELRVQGIQTRDYFRALHLQTHYGNRPTFLPVTEQLDRDVLALPMSSELTEEEAETVLVALAKTLSGASSVHEQLLPEVGEPGLRRQTALN